VSKIFKNNFARPKNGMEEDLKELIREQLVVDEQEIVRKLLPRIK
jgi:hypothetical protein